jgi:16S rRNA C967 or C1407 C5-methylase (RsmB/RsmF family)
MEKLSKLLVKLSQRLFENSDEREQFLESLVHPKSFNPCILWCTKKPNPLPFEIETPLPWQPEFVDRLAIGQRPGQHPLHDKGAFYCLDFSSVFAASPLLTISKSVSNSKDISVTNPAPDPRLPTSQELDLVLDMCASPGGKSIFAWIALRPKLLLSNEVIGKRMAQLIANLKRCRVSSAIVLRLDSKILAEEISQTAQVVLVDAPCTGQSLLAKGGKAPGCFHPVTINNNANRQKRILANSAQLVAPKGYLAYMTCTYSPEENEQVAEWLLERFPQFQPVKVPYLANYQSHLTQIPCYRMFPHQGLGAGAFTILLQNTEEGQAQKLPENFLNRSGSINLEI